MKKSIILLGVLVLFSSHIGTVHAQFKSGYTIVGIAGKNVTIKAENNEAINVSTSGQYKIGDKVKYDEKVKRIVPEKISCICSGG